MHATYALHENNASRPTNQISKLRLGSKPVMRASEQKPTYMRIRKAKTGIEKGLRLVR